MIFLDFQLINPPKMNYFYVSQSKHMLDLYLLCMFLLIYLSVIDYIIIN